MFTSLIPFCAQKCTYCNFASGVFPRSLEDDYAAALVAEIERHLLAWRPETVYLGGGTPSSIESGRVRKPFCRAFRDGPGGRRRSKPRPAPSPPKRRSRWRERAASIASAWGCSLSFARRSPRTGRKHTRRNGRGRYGDACAKRGSRNFNIDLIAGLAGQTMRELAANRSTGSSGSAPPHVSVYMLEVDEDSRLGSEILLGGVRYGAADVPSEERDGRDVRIRGRAAGEPGHSPLRDFELRAAGIRVAAQFEVLAAASRMSDSAPTRTPSTARVRRQNVGIAGRVCRACARRAQTRRAADLAEEKFFVGLRLMRRHPARCRKSGGAIEQPDPPVRRRRTARIRAATCCGSPAAACCCPTKSFRSF